MKSIEECLDIILDELIKNWDKPNGERDYLNGEDLLTKFDLPTNMRKHEFFKRLILRLIKDGNAESTISDGPPDMSLDIKFFQDPTLVTIEGYYFRKEKGGYAKERQINETSLKVKDGRDKRLVVGTWWVAGGALALVVWEMVKTFLIEHKSFCH